MTRRENTLTNVGALVLFLVDFRREQKEKGVHDPIKMYSNFVKYYLQHDEQFGSLPMMIIFSKSLDIFTDYGRLTLT